MTATFKFRATLAEHVCAAGSESHKGSAVPAHLDVDPLLATLRNLNAALGIAAKLTATTIDDTIHRGIEAVLSSAPLIAFIKQLAGDDDAVAFAAAGNSSGLASKFEAAATTEVRQAVAAAGFDWQKWLTVAMTIFQMIQPFLKK